MVEYGPVMAKSVGRLLVVDDEVELGAALCELLQAQCYETVGYTSGFEALEALRTESFDLLLTDLMMPGMGGIDLLQAALEIEPNLCGIIMTGQGTVETAIEAMKVGAFDYILKPFRMNALAPVLSRAMEFRRLRDETVQLHESLAIQELCAAVALTMDRDALLEKVADAALQLVGADQSSVMLPSAEGDELIIAAVRGEGRAQLLGRRVPLNGNIAGWVARHQEALTLTGPIDDPRIGPVDPRPEIPSSVSVPLMVGGKLIGVLNVGSTRQHTFSLGQAKALNILTSTAAAAIEHARLYAESREAEERYRALAARLGAVNEFARAAGSTLDPDSLFGMITREVETLMGCVWCTISEYAEPEDLLCIVAVSGSGGLSVGASYSAQHSGSGIALRTGAPYVVADTRLSSPEMTQQLGLARQGIRSRISVPITIDGRPWGTLSVGFGQPGEATPERVEFIVAAAAHLSIAIKNAQLYARLEDAYEDLRTSQRQIVRQERLRALGQMASGIAHDFNNALVPVLGFSELLMERPETLEDRDRVIHYLGLIRAGAEDGAAVVLRLREFYRDRDEDEVFRPVNLNEVAERVISLTQPRWKEQAQAGGVTIRAELDLAEVSPIAGNEADLREALTNLVFNAVDAMPEGGTFTVRTRSHGEAVSLEVADTGAGMPEAVRERCLEPLFTTKGEQGSGLGLAMVYGIVQRHEGTIDIESVEGEGTTVHLHFPVRFSPTGPEQPEGPMALRPLRVLVVDDQSVVRDVVAEYLEADGHSVEKAANGREALSRFEAGAYDLVVTDRGMPEMGGDQLAAAIKRQSPGTPVILLTGFGDLMKARSERPHGVDTIVPKPVDIATLRRAVAGVTHAGWTPMLLTPSG